MSYQEKIDARRRWATEQLKEAERYEACRVVEEQLRPLIERVQRAVTDLQAAVDATTVKPPEGQFEIEVPLGGTLFLPYRLSRSEETDSVRFRRTPAEPA